MLGESSWVILDPWSVLGESVSLLVGSLLATDVNCANSLLVSSLESFLAGAQWVWHSVKVVPVKVSGKVRHLVEQISASLVRGTVGWSKVVEVNNAPIIVV